MRHHERFNSLGWPTFTANQTDIRIALCRKAICPENTLKIKFKDCYGSDAIIQSYCKLKFTSEEIFTNNLLDIEQLGWGGVFRVPKIALEGAFYPFVRYGTGMKPVDTGCIWIGTKYEYPRIYIKNRVAEWLCPYSASGFVLTEPFEPLHKVLQNWSRLADRRYYPSLLLPPVPDL